MTSINNHTYLFYDFETTGINPCFDQVIRFAAIETDLSFNELKTHKINIKLRNDILPNPKALLVNRLAINDLQEGETEYDAFKKMHSLFNKPNTISIGYNSLKFDDLFLRFGFYRNLLAPYSHQYQDNSFRADLLRIAQVYFLYRHDQSIIWPMTNNRYSLQLEKINAVNGLFSGMSHDAEVDVRVSIELAKTLFNTDQKLWSYLIETFIKDIDHSRYLDLPLIDCINGQQYSFGILISNKIGIRGKFGAPVICQKHTETKANNILVFRLDIKDFENSGAGPLFDSGVYTKKFGEPDFIIPFVDKFILPFSNEVIMISKHNLNWIKHNPDLILEEFNKHHLPEYDKINDLDIDAALYEDGFFTKDEKQLMNTIHDSISTNINLALDRMSEGRIRELAIRLFGRNFPERLSNPLNQQYNEYLLSIFHNRKYNSYDYRGEPQILPSTKLNETIDLLKNNNLSDMDSKILNSLKDLIVEKTKKQQDLGF